MVDKCLEADSVVEDVGGELEVEGDGVGVVCEVVYFWELFFYFFNLYVLSVLFGPSVEVVL